MPYAPARVRSRAPWTAFLLVPLLALSSLLIPSAAMAADGPSMTATVSTASEADGITIAVDGNGFTDMPAHYISLAKRDSFTLLGAPAQITEYEEGSFSGTVSAATAALDRDAHYDVIAWERESFPSGATLYARAPITFTPEQWDAIFPPAAPTPSFGIEVTPDADLADGDTVTITGTFPATITATTGPNAGTALTTGVYIMYCDEPAGTVGTAAGRLTGDACDDTRQLSLASGPGTMGGTVTGTVTDGIWTFTTTITVAERTGTAGVFTRLYHGFHAGNVANPYLYDQFAPVTFATPTPTPSITAAVSDVSSASGVVVEVDGTGFSGMSAHYVSIVEKGSFTLVGKPAQITDYTDGAFRSSVSATAAQLDKSTQYEVIAWKSRTNPSDATVYARTGVTITPAQWNTLFPPPVVETPAPAAGHLSWGIKSAFRSYVTGPIAGGEIVTSGVSSALGSFVFPQAGAASLSNGLGTVGYSGSVRFTGHHGELDLRFSDPRVRIDSASSATLLVRVNGSAHVDFATLALSSGTRTASDDGAIRYAGVPATLTSAGATAFNGFYGAGEALDPVSFVIGSAGKPGGGTVVVASATTTTPANTPAPTPPATDGISVLGAPVEGGEITATADGFQPNESGILVVIYSTPTVLAENLTADASGRASWTGSLPSGLTGEHTLTFQGSIDRGVVLDIAPASQLQCTVSDAELVWGFKEAFRAYIDGSIANGEWTTDGAVSYATPVFTWAGGSGGADLGAGALDVRFEGSVRFTGHGGVLDTTVSDPRVVIDGDRALLFLDVSGTTRDGEAVEAAGVEFGALELGDVEPVRDGDTVTWTGIPATLTDAGSAAFGTYPAGDVLDALTIVATVDDACDAPVAEEPTTEADEELATEDASSEDGWPLWATVLIVVLVLLAIAALVIALVRRGRQA